MWIYYLFFFLIFVVYFNIKGRQNQLSAQKSIDKYINFVFIALWLLIGMRDINIGRDTLGYVSEFHNSTTLQFISDKKLDEPLYVYFEFVIRQITSNYHVFLMCASASICFAIRAIMKKYFTMSYEVVASICIYTLLGILSFNMAGIRQTIAMSLGIFAFISINNGKWKTSLLLIAIAYLFHNTAMLLLVLLPLHFIKVDKTATIVAIAFIVVSIMVPSLVSGFIGGVIESDDYHYAGYDLSAEGQSLTAFFLQLILVGIAFFRRKQIALPEDTKRMFFMMAYIGLAFQATSGVLFEMFRVSFYFSMFDIVLVPLALSTFKGSDSRLIKTAFIIGCLVYIFILANGDSTLPHPQNYQIIFE